MKRQLLAITIFYLFSSLSMAHAENYCTDGKMGAAYHLDELSGNAIDCTGNSNTAVKNGTITQGVTGKFATAYSFNNSNSTYLEAPAAASINTLTTPSWGAWIKPNSAGRSGNGCSGAGIVNKSDGSHGPEFCMNTDGSFEFIAWWSGGAVRWKTSTTPIVTGTFQHVAVTYSYSSSSNSPVFYYNGVVQGTTLISSSPSGSQQSDSGNTLHIGNEYSNQGGGFDGVIDEPFLANVTLSSTDISNIITHGLDGTYNNTSTSTINAAVLKHATNF